MQYEMDKGLQILLESRTRGVRQSVIFYCKYFGLI